MIELQHVSFRYETMLMDFDITVPKGSFTAVIGPSGGGKSTLLSLIAGFEEPLSGTIRVGGQDMAGVPPSERPVNMVFQDNNVFSHLDLWQNVAIGLQPSLKLSEGEQSKVAHAMTQVGIFELRLRKPGEVSGGERQRVAIARALVREKPVLLLDEPFAALGPSLRREMLDLAGALHKEKGLTVMMVSHQPEDARYAASHTAFIQDGKVLAMRPTAELFKAKDLPELKEYLGEW